jgi:hypothetical protein
MVLVNFGTYLLAQFLEKRVRDASKKVMDNFIKIREKSLMNQSHLRCIFIISNSIPKMAI